MDDKILHLIVSFIVGMLITYNIPDPLDLAIIALFCLAGILFEFHQESTSAGTFEMLDIIANCVGAFGAFVVAKTIQSKHRTRRDRDYYGG